LGRETIGLLHRIVECGADGLSQDDIEPYLLVRLLRCGYIRRADPSAAVFVATAAGLERSRFETLMSRRRDEERERRDIIRGRMQAMVERMELDRPPAPLPALRDLPGYRERIAPPWQQPQLPMLRSRALPPPQEQRPLAAPEDALRVIRDGEQRTRREQNCLGAAEARPRDIEGADWQIEHVGRLPSKR